MNPYQEKQCLSFDSLGLGAARPEKQKRTHSARGTLGPLEALTLEKIIEYPPSLLPYIFCDKTGWPEFCIFPVMSILLFL